MCPLIGPVFEKLSTFSQPSLTLQLLEPHQDLWNGRRRGGAATCTLFIMKKPHRQRKTPRRVGRCPSRA